MTQCTLFTVIYLTARRGPSFHPLLFSGPDHTMIKPFVLFSISVDNSTLEFELDYRWVLLHAGQDNASPEPTRRKFKLRYLLGLFKLDSYICYSLDSLETLSMRHQLSGENSGFLVC